MARSGAGKTAGAAGGFDHQRETGEGRLMRTVVISGAASGLGLASTRRLEASGHRVIGIDLHDTAVVADLGTSEGRVRALDEVRTLAGESLDGLVTFAGVRALPSRPASRVVSVNYFGTVALLDGLRPLLARGDRPAAIAISSNATTIQPEVPVAGVTVCLSGDEAAAGKAADEAGWMFGYPISKLAVARWVRRAAPGPEWAGAGIALNAIAPGRIDTPLVAEGRADPTLAPLIDQFQIPVGRTGQPDDIAALVEFLLGPDARFFCGSILFCDGGTDALLRADDWPAAWQPV